MRKFELVKEEHRKYPNQNIALPKRGSKTAAGYDFYLPKDLVFQPNEKILIWSDIKAIMEEDEVLIMHIRSSIGIKNGIVLSNITGVIDSDYANNPSNDGNIGLALWNTSDKTIYLSRGERICQGIFVKYLSIIEEEELEQREGGIGSTGTN